MILQPLVLGFFVVVVHFCLFLVCWFLVFFNTANVLYDPGNWDFFAF